MQKIAQSLNFELELPLSLFSKPRAMDTTFCTQ